ncbi:MAG TPA: SpoIIE family protein phosphatase [Candidatus Polarisedimenticolaceae bacterium]|nr:SpoIIE family protein phosphatase [Candidatus Polarisedimenticolaceae bacterium]
MRMEHHGRNAALYGLYGLLGLFFVWSAAYRIPMTRELARIVFHPDRVVATPLVASWPDGEITFRSRDLDARAVPPIQRGDRLISYDGHPFRRACELVRHVDAIGTHGTLNVVVSRTQKDGSETTIASAIRMRSAASQPYLFGIRVLLMVQGLIVPWLCFFVGFWVVLARPRDPMAWLVLVILLGFALIAGPQQTALERWPDALRISGAIYTAFLNAGWAVAFPLFGVHFAGRLPWERKYGWVKWILLGPTAVFAAAVVVATVIEALDLRGWLFVYNAVRIIIGPGTVLAMASISFFFLVMGWKIGVATDADARRRLRLLAWGGTLSLSPLLAVVVFIRTTGRALESVPMGVVIPCLLALAIFPIALAYVILVDRAMDVRVVVRQGLRYAVTRGAIRMIVVLFMLGVAWNAWNLVNDPFANRPRKLQAIALGMAAAVLLPRLAKRAFDWTDRRFFREAYDTEQVLTGLSEEVRTIGETGTLLDTVLDRIGETLHVDKLAVLLIDGDRFVLRRSRGFHPEPSVSIPATSDSLARLRESARPVRVRTDQAESLDRFSALDAEIILPLHGRRELLGAITLGPKKSEEPYSISDSKLLGSVASQTGLSLENTRLTETVAREIAQRERMSREIEIARDVQRQLFPQKLPEIPGVDCAGFCRPAQGVGGDYYDFLSLPGGRLGIALGDVAGKGIPAALLMAGLQASLRGQRLSGPSDLAQLMVNMNHLIYEASPDNRYATFFYGELDPKTRRLDYVNAGHNAPMLFRVSNGHVERLPATGPVVGLVTAGRYEQRSVVLEPRDLLLVYSDGISEAMNGHDEEWGEARLAEAVRTATGSGAGELIRRLFVSADAFSAGAVQHDDMTVVVLRIER